MEQKRSKARVFIFALVVGLLLFACAAMLRRSMERERVERRLSDTRTAINDATSAAADSPLEHAVRAQLTQALARATPESLDRPVIAAAVVPEWKKELQLHWIAKRPDAIDAIEVTAENQPPMRRSLPSQDIEANRKEAATRVLYTNTVEAPELEKLLAATTPGARVTVVLIAQGQVVSDPADVTIGAK